MKTTMNHCGKILTEESRRLSEKIVTIQMLAALKRVVPDTKLSGVLNPAVVTLKL
jgi:hypothetical protein